MRKLLSYVGYCSRMTRSVTAAKKHCQTSATSSTSPAFRHAPYWMRHPRTASADTDSSANSNVVSASTERETVVGSTDDGFQSTASTSHSCDCSTELAASGLRAPKMQMSTSQCFCSRSSRLESCVKRANGGKPACCEAAGRLLHSNSVEGHSATGSACGDNERQRLHCSSGGECCPYTTHTSDSAGVSFGPTECQHAACSRMSSASTYVDRPWVSMFAPLVELGYLRLSDEVMFSSL